MNRVLGSLAFLAGAAAIAGGAVLLVSALWKFQDLSAFQRVIEGQGFFGSWAHAASMAVPVVEGAVALAVLILSQSPVRISTAALLLAVFFALLTGYAMALHLCPPPKPTSCGCGFSDALVHDWSPIVTRNGACAAAYGTLAMARRSRSVSPNR